MPPFNNCLDPRAGRVRRGDGPAGQSRSIPRMADEGVASCRGALRCCFALLLFDPLGSIRPFDRMIGSDQPLGVKGGPRADGNVAGQLAIGKFVLVDVELKLVSGLRNRRSWTLPFARVRLRLAAIGAAEVWRTRLSLRQSREDSCGEHNEQRHAAGVLDHWSIRQVSSPLPELIPQRLRIQALRLTRDTWRCPDQ